MKRFFTFLLGALIVGLGIWIIGSANWDGWTTARVAGSGVGSMVILAGVMYLSRALASEEAMVTSRALALEDGVLKSAGGLVYALPGTVLRLTLVFRGQGEVREVEDASTEPRALRVAFVEEDFKIESILVADDGKRFVLEPTDNQWWSLTNFKISISPEGLLISVGGTLQDERQEMVAKWVETAGVLLRPGGAVPVSAARFAPRGGSDSPQALKFVDLEDVTATVTKLYRVGEGESGRDRIPLGKEFRGIQLEEHERHAVVEEITRKAKELVVAGQPTYQRAALRSDAVLEVRIGPESATTAGLSGTAAELTKKFSGAEDAVIEGVLYVIPGSAQVEARLDAAKPPFYQGRFVIPECGVVARLPLNAHSLSKSTLEVQFDSATGRATTYSRSSNPQSTERIQAAYKGLMTGVDKAAEKDETLKQSLASSAQKVAQLRVKLVAQRTLLEQTQMEIGELEKRPAPTEKTRHAITSRKRLAAWLVAVISELERGYDAEYGPAPTVTSMDA